MVQKVPADQRERFEQAARELGVDLDEEKLIAALRQVAMPAARPLPRLDWIAVRSAAGVVEVSLHQRAGYRHWTVMPESDLPDYLAVADDLKSVLVNEIDVPTPGND